MTRPAMVVVGSYNHDSILSVSQFPRPGETIHALGSASSHGGKGSNQAVQAARMGAAVAIVACVGRDSRGDGAIALWQDEGIDAALVSRIEDAPTGSATILVDSHGENLIVVERGANARLSKADIDRAVAAIADANVVVAQLETSADVARVAFAHARRGGATTILNAAPAPDFIDLALLDLTDLLIVNEEEARALGAGGESAAAAARSLLARVGQGVILTAGERGAMLFQRGRREVVMPPPPIVPQDTTGAGDALVGAIAAMLAADRSLSDALELAVKAGAFACSRSGAVSSFGTHAQIAEWHQSAAASKP